MARSQVTFIYWAPTYYVPGFVCCRYNDAVLKEFKINLRVQQSYVFKILTNTERLFNCISGLIITIFYIILIISGSLLEKSSIWLYSPRFIISWLHFPIGEIYIYITLAGTVVLLEGAISMKECYLEGNTKCLMKYLQIHSSGEIVLLTKMCQKTYLVSIFKLLLKYQDGHGNLIRESGYTKISYSKFSQNFTRSGCNIMAQNLCFSISFWEIQQQ